jgi:epoxyqueuosine reductase QueG
MNHLADPRAFIQDTIRDFLENSPDNSLHNGTDEKAWDDFLVGFSAGDDPLYRDYQKRHVGPFHWTPAEIFELTFPGSNADPGQLTVVTWILPQREATKADNRRETTYPSERWARARIFGEAANKGIRERLVEALAGRGVQAVAPLLSPQWTVKISPRFGLASTWSERHAAFAAGLGTFGLCDGLITPRGKAMRVGSVVARLEIEPTPRPYTDHREYCLFFSRGICKRCIDRCPAGAITEAGKDKAKCLAHLKPGTSDYVTKNFGFDGYGCGLCQTGVPCESKIPAGAEE